MEAIRIGTNATEQHRKDTTAMWKRLIFIMIGMIMAGSLSSVPAGAEERDSLTPEELSGESTILIDAQTGTVLFEKNPHLQLYPASITKIATGIYAIENGELTDLVTVSKRARNEEGTRVYLAEGEQVELLRLVYGLLMNSGNDAATAIAEHLGGSNEAFAEKLNQYLKEKIGVTETHFTNPHGLHDPNHYTTASDMAKIARYAMRNSLFREIVSTKYLPWNGKEWQTTLVNHNRLLWDYEGTTGIKNGFTDQARNTLVVSAKRGESEFIAVTMKAQSSHMAYRDVTAMLDYAFSHFETKRVAKAGEEFGIAPSRHGKKTYYYAANHLFVTVPLGTSVIREITLDGQLKVTMNGKEYHYFPLLEKQEVHLASKVHGEGDKPGNHWTLTAVAVFWLFLNLTFVAFAVLYKKKKQGFHTKKQWHTH